MRRWINNGINNKRVPPEKVEEYLQSGWVLGQLPTTSNHIWINKDGKNSTIPKEKLDDYLSQGWTKGKILSSKELDRVKVNKDGKTVLISKSELNDYLSQGWQRGIHQKFRWITNGQEESWTDKSLEEGWHEGRLLKNPHKVVSIYNDSEVLEVERKDLFKHPEYKLGKGKLVGLYEGSTKNTVWVNDRKENKLINKDDLQKFLEKGYQLGQTKDRVLVHNETETKRVRLSDLDSYLSQGFILGSCTTSSMFGKKWVCKNDKFIVIDASELESYLKDGWQNGRPVAASKGKIWVHKDNELTYIDPRELKDYIEHGWHAGRTDEKFFINNGVESKYVNGDEYRLYYKDWKLGTATRGRVSSVEIKFKDLLEENNIKYEMHFYLPSESRKYYFDFKVGNILIELNPTITHNSTWAPFGDLTPTDYHYLKTKTAVEKGYQCINIWDWDNIDVLLSLLKPRQRVYARSCELKEVNKKEAEEFINKNHFQGYARDSIRLGLYYNDDLVSIMTFGKPRYNKNYEYELIRYCSSCEVVGGAEKLFINFKRIYSPKSVISYCDMSKFTGKTYEKLGFKDDGFSIGKHWYNMKSKKHLTDNLLRQQGFDRLFGTSYGKGTSNEQLMLEAGFLEIYDCGQRRWRY